MAASCARSWIDSTPAISSTSTAFFQNEGIREDIRRAFVIYLVSHDRPISEPLTPNRENLKQVVADQFVGMTIDPVPFAALETARDQLIERIKADLTNAEREFLLSMNRLEPKWEQLDMPGIERLPGPQTQVSVTDRMIKSRAGISIPTLSAEPSVDDLTKEVVPDSG